MAFATLHDTDAAGGVAQSVGSSIPVDFPTNVSSGDLLILIVAGDNTNRGITAGPSGYSTFIAPDDDISSGTGPIAAFYKVAAGTETGSTTLTQASGINTQYAYMHLRFSGWSGTLGDVDVSALSEAASTLSTSTVDVTAGTGAGDNLFCSIFTTHNTGGPTVTDPTNFTGTTLQYDSPNEATICLDQEQDTGATFGSGGTWSYTDGGGATNVRTFTFIVPPAAASPEVVAMQSSGGLSFSMSLKL